MAADIDFLKAVADWENLTNNSRLVELIKRMKQEERNKLQKYVHFAYNHSDGKPYQLLVLVMESLKQNITLAETDFQKLIGEKYTDEAFNMLVLRLKEKFEDFLVSPFNIEREGSFFHSNIQEAYKIGRRADLLSVLAAHSLNEELILTANKYIARVNHS